MDSNKGKRLVLFSNTFPYGKGETFLADELPFVAAEFESVIIYPLFKVSDASSLREVPQNVEVEAPLLDFEDKDRRALLDAGLLDLFPFTWKGAPWFPCKEFWSRALLGRNIPLLTGQRRAGLKKRIWIFFNYLFIYRAILGNKKRWEEVVSTCALADIVYFYWGDKSVMTAPVLKRKLSEICTIVPKICARLHGSDLYEGAKGYLPLREEIYGALDLAAVDSEHGYSYIRDNYKAQPGEVRACFMGSVKPLLSTEACHGLPDGNGGFIPANKNDDRGVLRLVSCSNVIELKRVDLIFRSIIAILENPQLLSKLRLAGYSKISWTHFGSGNLLEKLQNSVAEYFKPATSEDGSADITVGSSNSTLDNPNKSTEPRSFVLNLDSETLHVKLMGQTPHAQVLKYYEEAGGDLFLLLSRTEGVPISLMEALSYSIPIVATSVGGVPEVFEDKGVDVAAKTGVAAALDTGFKKYDIGYLMNASPRIEDIVDAILDYAELPQEAKAQMDAAAFARWQTRWDGSINYRSFTQLLSSLCA